MRIRVIALLMGLLLGVHGLAMAETGLSITTTAPENVVSIEQMFGDDKVLLSVKDPSGNPVHGLNQENFTVTAAGRTARILSAEPVSESLDVPRNIVLVLDNSFSMIQRNAVKPLLEGVDELLKIARPIDHVQVVVFSKDPVNLGGRDLHVKTFASQQVVELKNFVSGIYKDHTTSTTVLYEGILAGLDLIRATPENEPRFMVVFSDGEDLNSAYKSDDVLNASRGIDNFHLYTIDYMPVATKNKFLTEIAEGNRGEIWKATSETNLVPIFQSVASRMVYYYMVTYLFPTTGNLGVSPEGLNIDEVENFDALAMEKPETVQLDISRKIDASGLQFRPAVDSAYSIERWTLKVSNDAGVLFTEFGKGLPPAEILLPLDLNTLGALAAGGNIRASMEVVDSKGQTVELASAPVTVNPVRTKGNLTVAPASLNLDEVTNFDAAGGPTVMRKADQTSLTLRPVVEAPHGVTRWSVTVANGAGTLAERSGEGVPEAEITVPLEAGDLDRVAAGGDIKVTMEVQDQMGQNLVLAAKPVKVNLIRTTGSLTVSPGGVTIEEIKTIDSSPMLGYVYFGEGSSEIPEQYVRLGSPEETAGFDETRFRDTLEKYYQVLNIIGKRLADHPDATIALVGCNADYGPEKGDLKLSTARAEMVRDYLQTVWTIAPERMQTDARNLPEAPSSSRLEEGRAENRRVEIRSESGDILAPIRSTYLATRIDNSVLTLIPAVNAGRGVARWTVTATNQSGTLGEVAGEGAPPLEISLPLKTTNLNEMATGGNITVRMAVQDVRGQELSLTGEPVTVTFIQTSQRMAEKQDVRVQEKYALILFDFDSDAISVGNEKIVSTIVTRMGELPEATAEIVGHSDNIGKEEYNIKLSERRALAVYKVITAAFAEDQGERIRHRGVGPNEPLYDNTTPEARAFNRTVTITLEYLAEN